MALPQKKKNNNKSSSLPNISLPSYDESLKELNQDELINIQKEEFYDDKPREINYHSIPKQDKIIGHDDNAFISNPNESNDFKDYNDDKFIDKQDMKIVPIGGKKAKAKDFDKRKNTLTPLKIFRILLILSLIHI